MKFLCQECEHKAICKFEDTYRRVLDNLQMKIDAPFTLELKCPYFTVKPALYLNTLDYNTTSTTGSTLNLANHKNIIEETHTSV